MNTQPIIVEQTYNASVEKVWSAITDKNEMKQWYFNIAEFKAQPGFEFKFIAMGPDEKEFIHLCKVVDVIKNKKLSYTWRYEGYEGNTLVTWELSAEENKTHLRLMHEGLETFPNVPDLARSNFEAGWNAILGTSLKEYLEK